MKDKDMIGKRFGRLVVIEKSEPINIYNRKSHSYWKCICDCGNEKLVRIDHLIRGHVKSCGCLGRESKIKHGMINTKLYKVWDGIKSRCNNPNSKAYKNYGGRGIKICESWNDFMTFHKWSIESGYEEGLTLDRIDVNGNYEPSNCRWVTRKKQARNTRKTIYATINNKTMDLCSWADEIGENREKLYRRVHKLGWTPEEAVLGKRHDISEVPF